MNADNSGPALASVLRDTLAPATLASLLHELATSAESRAEMCRQSYVHQNSFVKIVLVESLAPMFKLRLHVWRNGSVGPKDSDIHNHRWDFASRVLAGRFVNRIFAEPSGAENNQGACLMRWHRYLPRASKDTFVLRYLSMRPVAEIETRPLEAGTIYWMAAGELHRLDTVGSDLHASLVLQGSVVRAETDVYSERVLDDGAHLILSPPLAEPTLIANLEAVGSILKRTQHSANDTAGF
jgi:hypothetical protein